MRVRVCSVADVVNIAAVAFMILLCHILTLLLQDNHLFYHILLHHVACFVVRVCLHIKNSMSLCLIYW